jgi:hypothetical protein
MLFTRAVQDDRMLVVSPMLDELSGDPGRRKLITDN